MLTTTRSPARTRTQARTVPILAAFVGLALASSAGPAAASHPETATAAWDRAARGSLVDVQVLVEGRSAPLYLAPGHWDRRYFQAFRGRHYALRVTNRSSERVGVLISVDGLNVVSGERSSLGRDEGMYVLDPWESATIRGWRTSLEQVRQFVFVDEERSYATRTGQANGDMGWIRVLAFLEQRPVVWCEPRPLPDRCDEKASPPADDRRVERDFRGSAGPNFGAPKRSDARPSPHALQGPRAEKSLADGLAGGSAAQAYPGTGWGERRQDPVRETWFVAAAAPTDHLILRYEYERGLLALGLDLGGDRLQSRERGELGFAQPPRW